jgi:hypothetical protein
MKKIKNILLLFGSMLFISSCSDALDIEQEGEVSRGEAFKTVTDLRNYLNGDVYSRLNNTNEISFTTVFTDEVSIGVDSGGQGISLHRFQLNANDGDVSGLWSNHYTVINRVNRLIEFSDLVVVTTPADIAAKNAVLAEARALRAYAYTQLIAFFSVDVSNPAALGVILSTSVQDPLIVRPNPRVSNQVIYDQIDADLLFATTNLGNPTNYRFVTQRFINALKARYYLYRKDYANAETFATAALTGLPLSNAAAYNTLWNDAAQGETIFAISRPTGGTWSNIASTWYFNQTNATGGAFFEMSRNLFNLYNANPSDVRRTTWIDASAVINPGYATDINYLRNDILPINKYPGKAPAANLPLRNDLKVFRSSEMALIIAECKVGGSTPNLIDAAARVQSIRTARGTGEALPVYANAQEAWNDILLERRKELAFEGHRYLDIKRLAALAGNQGITRDNTDDNILGLPLTLSLSDHRFTLPIPQLERAGNTSILQNPGY